MAAGLHGAATLSETGGHSGLLSKAQRIGISDPVVAIAVWLLDTPVLGHTRRE